MIGTSFSCFTCKIVAWERAETVAYLVKGFMLFWLVVVVMRQRVVDGKKTYIVNLVS